MSIEYYSSKFACFVRLKKVLSYVETGCIEFKCVLVRREIVDFHKRLVPDLLKLINWRVTNWRALVKPLNGRSIVNENRALMPLEIVPPTAGRNRGWPAKISENKISDSKKCPIAKISEKNISDGQNIQKKYPPHKRSQTVKWACYIEWFINLIMTADGGEAKFYALIYDFYYDCRRQSDWVIWIRRK